MPASLYHPVFRQWCIRASDTEFKVPPEVVAATAKLMQASSVLYSSEDARKKATRGHLQNAIGHSIPTVKNDDGTTPDGRTTVEVNYEHSARAVLVMVDEEKRDSADSRADASTQAVFSMVRAWMMDDVSAIISLVGTPALNSTFCFASSLQSSVI